MLKYGACFPNTPLWQKSDDRFKPKTYSLFFSKFNKLENVSQVFPWTQFHVTARLLFHLETLVTPMRDIRPHSALSSLSIASGLVRADNSKNTVFMIFMIRFKLLSQLDAHEAIQIAKTLFCS